MRGNPSDAGRSEARRRRASAPGRPPAGRGEDGPVEGDRPATVPADDADRGEAARRRRADSTIPAFADPDTEQWIDEGEVRDEARGAVRRGSTGGGRTRSSSSGSDRTRSRGRRGGAPARAEAADEIVPGAAAGEVDVREALVRAVGAQRGARLARRVDEAGEAFAGDRFDDAVRILRPIVREAPTVAASRELLGLSLYRLGRWKQAVAELEAFRTLTNGTDQHLVLADCYRALGRHDDVEALWDELRGASPSAPVVTEGRIVAAGSKADRGDLRGAIALLSAGWSTPKRPLEHHVRRAYALADLYERAGDVPRARELFGWIARSAPDATDAAQRLRNLG